MKKIYLFPLILLFKTTFAQIPTTGLLAHYGFCGSANDLSGNGNHGVVNGPVLSADRFGKQNNAYYFNGTSDYIDLPVSAFKGLDVYSYSVWFKPVTTAVSLVYSIGSNDPYCQSLSFNSNAVSGGSYNQGGSPVQSYVFSPSMSIVNNWIHVVVTRDLNSIKMYVNGVQSQVLSSALTNNQQADYGGTPPYKAVLGTRSTLNQYFFEGYIDDVRIYSSVLNPSDVIALYNESQPALSVNSGTLCVNHSFTLAPSGASSYSYSSGSAVVSPKTTTAYTVSGVGPDGCVVSGVSSVSVYPAPTVTINGKTVLCQNQSTTLSAVGAVNYSWSTGSNLNSIPVTPTGTLSVYSVTYTNQHGCDATSQVTVKVENCTSLTDQVGSDLQLFVNPSSGDLHVKVEIPENYILVIYDISGKVVQQLEINPEQSTYHLSGQLTDGLYLVHLSKQGSVIAAKKVIIGR